jgi:hypothetical protein
MIFTIFSQFSPLPLSDPISRLVFHMTVYKAFTLEFSPITQWSDNIDKQISCTAAPVYTMWTQETGLLVPIVVVNRIRIPHYNP